jgi:hypothetical protein
MKTYGATYKGKPVMVSVPETISSETQPIQNRCGCVVAAQGIRYCATHAAAPALLAALERIADKLDVLADAATGRRFTAALRINAADARAAIRAAKEA